MVYNLGLWFSSWVRAAFSTGIRVISRCKFCLMNKVSENNVKLEFEQGI